MTRWNRAVEPGLVRVAICQLNTVVGDPEGNAAQILAATREALTRGAELALFPELAIPGYPPLDLLERRAFRDAVAQAETDLVARLPRGITAVFGSLGRSPGPGTGITNGAVVAQTGQVRLRVAKTLLPTYDVFDEARYFDPAPPDQPASFEQGGRRFGVTICEDIWNATELATEGRRDPALPDRTYRRDPVAELVRRERPHTLLNLSASPWSWGKEGTRQRVASEMGRRHGIGTLYCNLVGGNDGLLFDGHSLAFDRQGHHCWTGPGWTPACEVLDLDELGEAETPTRQEVAEIRMALELGIRDYFDKIGLGLAVIGLSGGIDSAVTAALAVGALGPERVRTLAMPSPYSSEGSVQDALTLAKHLGVRCDVVRIDPMFQAFQTQLAPLFVGTEPDVTEENLQSRIRGTLLMAMANKFGGVVLNTGNKAEAAMGYATLYGDAIGALSVLGDLYKHQVYELAEHLNRDSEIIPRSSIEKPPSAELRPGQKDEDSLPPYPQLDAMLRAFLEHKEPPELIAAEAGVPIEEVRKVVQAVYRAEFKRKQLPPTLRVSTKAWVGRRYPIVQRFVER
ncbi:MAG TPA: NAD+ synthase [Myxococcales bacterium LLY-WYZ-16_1]|nr:NAD+ synthase [Myxococcales bacterium LLY-WYZ-16_1]